MKRFFTVKLLGIFMLTLALMASGSGSASAAGSGAWEKAEGAYVWTESAQYSSGMLYVKPIEDELFLFEFKVMRGSEAEDSSYDFTAAGIFAVDDSGLGETEFEVDQKPVKLTFALKGRTIAVKQDGSMPADVSGSYEYLEKNFDISEAAAAAVLEGIAPVKTSLNASNRPYSLVCDDETVDGWFYAVKAVNQPSGREFARFLVAADLSAVYRSDDGEAPILIYGSPESMLSAKTAPLLQEEQADTDEDLDLPAGAELDSRDSETPPYEEQSRLSAVVSVGPVDPDIKVGESSRLTVSLPGGLPYTLSELKSGAADKVSVDGSGVLTAKAEGKAEISGKLTVDGVSKEFKVEVSAYVPKA